MLALLAAAAVNLPARGTTRVVLRPPERVVIPAGAFRMGSPPEQVRGAYAVCTEEYRAAGAALVEASLRCTSRFDGEGPQRSVSLRAFAIDRTEVTVGAYRACVARGACDGAPLVEARRTSAAGDTFPIEAVTWDEAVAYCRFRGGRLPSEAEWEKAARGPLGLVWPWGDRWEGGRASHGRRARLSDEGAEGGTDAGDGHEGAAPAGSFPGGASPYGVLDLSGNVWEWTDSPFRPEALAPVLQAPAGPGATLPGAVVPPGATDAGERVVRGGSYDTPASDLRAARRIGLPPGERHLTVGFRCGYDRT